MREPGLLQIKLSKTSWHLQVLIGKILEQAGSVMTLPLIFI
jgi:hypothetical protein